MLEVAHANTLCMYSACINYPSTVEPTIQGLVLILLSVDYSTKAQQIDLEHHNAAGGLATGQFCDMFLAGHFDNKTTVL